MPPKEKTKAKPFTLEQLEAAAQQKAKAEQAVAEAERAFEQGAHSQEQYQRIAAAKVEHGFHVRVFDLASESHAKFERDEAARAAAEAEAQRQEQLAGVEDDIAKNIAASIAAGEALVQGLKTGWSLAVLSQSLSGSPINSWSYEVQEAIGRALVAEGFSAGAIRV